MKEPVSFRSHLSQNLRHIPMAWAAIAAAAGLVFADLTHDTWWWILLIPCLSFTFLIGWHRNFVFLSLVACFGLTHTLRIASQEHFPLHKEIQETPIFVTATGVVVDAPRAFGKNTRYPLKLEQFSIKDASFSAQATVMVESRSEAPEYGDRISINGFLKPPPLPRNPGTFNIRTYLYRKGISVVLDTKRNPFEVLATDQASRLPTIALRCRNWIADAITKDIQGEEAAGIIKAMTLGAKEDTSRETHEDFRLSGTMHIFAVSGLHVGIVAIVIWALLRTLGMRQSHAILLIIPCVLMYAFITGWRPSAIRAAIMTSLICSGYLVGRPTRVINSLGAAAFIIFIWDSHQLFTAGFQLSFAVLMSLALLARPLQSLFERYSGPDPFIPKTLITWPRRLMGKATSWVSGSLAVSSAAWLGSTPLMLWYFQTITPIGIVANLVMIPAAFGVLSLSFLSLGSHFVHLVSLNAILNNANLVLASMVGAGAAGFADIPGGHYHIRSLQDFPRYPFHITILDTADGGAANHLIVNKNQHWLLDCADKRKFYGVVSPLLQYRNTQKLEGFVMSHADARHVGGAPTCFDILRPSVVVRGERPRSSPSDRNLCEAADLFQIPIATHQRADSFEISAGVTMNVIFPDAYALEEATTLNDGCLVFQLIYHDWKILFVSDSGLGTYEYLRQSGINLESDVLVQGLHSALPFIDTDFINAVAPKAIVSSNAPYPEAEKLTAEHLHFLEHTGARLFDQCRSGAVEINANPSTLRLRGFLSGETVILTRR